MRRDSDDYPDIFVGKLRRARVVKCNLIRKWRREVSNLPGARPPGNSEAEEEMIDQNPEAW